MAKRALYAAALVVFAAGFELTFFWRTTTCDAGGCGPRPVLGILGLVGGAIAAYVLALLAFWVSLGERRWPKEARPWRDLTRDDPPGRLAPRSSPGPR